MTTVTEKAVEAIEAATQEIEQAVEVIAEAEHSRWKGNIVNHQLNARAESIAAALEPLVTVNDKGLHGSKKAYYNVAEKHGFDTKALKDMEGFQEDFAHAVHAIGSDKALSRFREDVEAKEFNVKVEIGERTKYTDNYRRHDERSVSGGPGKERIMKSTYGYHNPSIETEYKGFNESRAAVQNLARDLLG